MTSARGLAASFYSKLRTPPHFSRFTLSDRGRPEW